MDPRNGYLLGGIILFALVWLVLVPAAILSGHRRRKKTPEASPTHEPPVRLHVTTWQSFSGNLEVLQPPASASSNGPLSQAGAH